MRQQIAEPLHTVEEAGEAVATGQGRLLLAIGHICSPIYRVTKTAATGAGPARKTGLRLQETIE
ncbi:hypothetical protein GCM10009096_16050 [Parasphingorhabdus litoris]|uniref:Uncharacterized protein n=1 Tax=Parasphingorhabdus litoris TaxID=394733 RepID=A0ABN1AFG3_9SPHN